MGTNDWNISNIIMTILRERSSYSYAKIAAELGVSEQSLSDWRKGVRSPQRQNIETICTGIPQMVNPQEHGAFLSDLKNKLKNAGDLVIAALNDCPSLSDALFYLYNDFQSHLVQDKLYLLLNSHEGISLLRDILLRKFQLNEKRTLNFKVEELGYAYQNELKSKNLRWKLNLNHCLLIKFKDDSKKYSYKVLMDFNFNQKEHASAGDYAEARDAARFYGVKMLLLFGNFQIPHNELRLFIDSNIYAEKIETSELRQKTHSKDYIYSPHGRDAEMELFANKYADLIIGRLKKYHSVIYKNIQFEKRRNPVAKNQPSYIYWNAKYAASQHVSFQTSRIETLLQDGSIPTGGQALAIGYFSFPSLLRLESYFDHIYLLDNSNTSVKAYEQHLSEHQPQLLDKITFITFTSSMYHSISNIYQLYHSMDFILLGTGSGSLIKKMKAYYQMCNSWLNPNGSLYVSFLNRDFLFEYVDQNTTEQNFDFIPVPNTNHASAFLANTLEKYDLYCETYEFNELKAFSEKYFTAENFYSYPLASVLENSHKKMLQNILNELDKEYSNKGFLTRSFSNCRGYYLDAYLKKKMQPLITCDFPKDLECQTISHEEIRESKSSYLKLLLLAEPGSSQKQAEQTGLPFEVYLFLLPANKKLPENDRQKVCLGAKTLRFLSITEINALGLEFQNIPPFLHSCSSKIKLNKNYDAEIQDAAGAEYYLDNGSQETVYKISGKDLISALNRLEFYDAMIPKE